MSDANTLERRKASPEYQRMKANFADESWRINNLYFVQDEAGERVPFVQREPQRAYYDSRWFLDIITKGRQLGFSTEIAVEMCDTCTFRSNTAAGIIDYKLEDAKKKLDKVRFAYQNLPTSVRQKVMLLKDNEEEMHFSNGSRIEVGTSHRGGTLQFLHVSEFGKIAAEKPDAAREIATGAFNTVHSGQRIVVEATAHGTSGRFKDMVVRAQAKELEGTALSPLDWRLHFFAWWRHKGYRLPNHLIVLTIELREYFSQLKGAHGIQLDADQQAWYASKRAELGLDDCREEFPSTIAELFYNSVEGAYFKRELSIARQEGRIGHPVPYDPTRSVYTMLDIGVDGGMVLIFAQTDGLRHRIIDCCEDEEQNGSVQLYARWLRDKAAERGFKYSKHYAPHDMAQREWGSEAKSRFTMAKELGIDVEVVPKIDDKADSIEIARRFIGMCWFDEVHAKRVVECLDNYRKKWNKTTATWSGDPLKNGFDHGADAFQNGACGYTPDPAARTSSGRSRSAPRGVSPWGA